MARRDIDAELERVAADFHELLNFATIAELRAPTNGTKWTNKHRTQCVGHRLQVTPPAAVNEGPLHRGQWRRSAEA